MKGKGRVKREGGSGKEERERQVGKWVIMREGTKGKIERKGKRL